MKLKEWLEKEHKTMADMARDLELEHPVVRAWAIGQKIPRPETMAKIVAYTKGEVTANDFYGIEEKEVINNEQSS